MTLRLTARMGTRFPRRAAVVLLACALVFAACSSGSKAQPTPQQQRGFALPTWHHDGYSGAAVANDLHAISTIGSRWVEIVPTWYQDDLAANEIHKTHRTVDDAGVRRAIKLAHDQHLAVLLKPHIDVANHRSRLLIKPSDPGLWFASYQSFITHYADMADQLGVEQFAVGTELASVSGDRKAWTNVIKAVRDQYHGTVLYAANFSEYQHVAFWDKVDMVGLDAYFPIANHPTHNLDTLKAGWAPVRSKLAAFAGRVHKRILFTEAGFPSQRGAVTAPSDARISRERDDVEQSVAYQSLLLGFQDQSWWAGVLWWLWSAPPGESRRSYQRGYAIHGKQAEKVVRRWWQH